MVSDLPITYAIDLFEVSAGGHILQIDRNRRLRRSGQVSFVINLVIHSIRRRDGREVPQEHLNSSIPIGADPG